MEESVIEILKKKKKTLTLNRRIEFEEEKGLLLGWGMHLDRTRR